MKLVAGVVSTDVAASLRARLADRWQRYALLDRGSFDFVDEPEVDALVDAITTLARVASGRPLVAVERVRAVRMLPGDYVLVRHDTVYDDRPVEVVADVSAAPVTGAEVHYRHRGQVFFVVPSQPGAVAVVERGPTVMRNSTYVSKRWKDAEVVRLFFLLRGGA